MRSPGVKYFLCISICLQLMKRFVFFHWLKVQPMLLYARVSVSAAYHQLHLTFFFSFICSTFWMQPLVKRIKSLSLAHWESFFMVQCLLSYWFNWPLNDKSKRVLCVSGERSSFELKNAFRTGLTVGAVQHLFTIWSVAKCGYHACLFFFFFFFFKSSLVIFARMRTHSDTDTNNVWCEKKNVLYAILDSFTFGLGE